MEPRFKHYCPDWDYDEIDEFDPEFECCTCYKELYGKEKVDKPDEAE